MQRTLGSRVVVGCWVHKVTGDHVDDGHLDRESLVGGDGVAVLRVHEFRRWHLVRRDDAPHLILRLDPCSWLKNGTDIRGRHCSYHP